MMCKIWIIFFNFNYALTIKDMEIAQSSMLNEKRVLYLREENFNPYGEDSYPAIFATYYQALKHGWIDKSFATEHAIPVRLTKEANYSKDFRENTQITPDVFRNKLDCTPYDYVIIRSSFNAKTLTTLFKENPQCDSMQVIVETKSLILFISYSI